jgi:hypothetical protein
MQFKRTRAMVPAHRLGVPTPGFMPGGVVAVSRILGTIRHLDDAPRIGVTVPLAGPAQ